MSSLPAHQLVAVPRRRGREIRIGVIGASISAAPRQSYSRRLSPGFTLVELLAVIGIIGVLIAMLLPALGRAREQARQIKCLSNMRQIAMALNLYATENRERYPAPAVGSLPDDWIYWQPGRDINQSAIVPYTGGGRFNSELFTCPSDNLALHTLHNAYAYSYTVNERICNWFARAASPPQRVLSRAQIRHPSEKILMIDESSETIDDGCWAPQNYVSDGKNLISNRHTKQIETSNDPNAGSGNAAFVDGHAASISRIDSTKSTYWDPLVN